jgi:hypothetical protein
MDTWLVEEWLEEQQESTGREQGSMARAVALNGNS